MRKMPATIASTITKTGKKKGNPMTRTPNIIGSNATAAAANGTVGTSKNFADGNLIGKDFVTVLKVESATDEMESITWNHDCVAASAAPISVRYGPERHNLRRNVG